MSITGEHLALFVFWVMLGGVLWMPLTWLLLSIFTPNSLLDKYFKEPHFTLTETYMMRGWPGFLMRTAIFGWSLILPSLGKKRQIKETWKYMPLWYVIALNILTIGSTITLLIIVVLLPILVFFDF
ncbi:hypothetical protein BGP75_15345 [Motiliproteus sp. MSK22-1]|nr:hypothetical protein BGP75_15345 [Motiliproteus sp. MSK22-1]